MPFGVPSTATVFGSGTTQNAPSTFAFGKSSSTPNPTFSSRVKTTPTAFPTPTATHPTSLANGADGVVSFPSCGLTSYRFEIVAKDGKLLIWLEDRKTKKQWYVGAAMHMPYSRDDGRGS
jgi:hypothetical protein